MVKTLRNTHLQPSPLAFSARSILDSTVSCDVNERYSPALFETSRGQQGKRERLGTRLTHLVASTPFKVKNASLPVRRSKTLLPKLPVYAHI